MKACFAAGCFWGIQALFSKQTGVSHTEVGYTGGNVVNPSYELVCQGRSGHAEAVLIEFDPKLIGFEDLLEVFWSCHNPCSLNAQGPDIGSQYRSAIFCYSAEQYSIALESLADKQQSGRYTSPIVTQIKMASEFYQAEAYHQYYIAKQDSPGDFC